jgi:hypothetical protein
MLPRHAHHKPFTVKFSDKSEWHNGFNPDNKRGLFWYTAGSKTNLGTGAGVYRWGLRTGHSFSLGLHTMALQAEICGLKACMMEKVGKDNTSRYIYIFSVRQPSKLLTVSK